MQLFTQQKTQPLENQFQRNYHMILYSYCELSQEYYQIIKKNTYLNNEIQNLEKNIAQINSYLSGRSKQNDKYMEAIQLKIFGNETIKPELEENQLSLQQIIKKKSAKKRIRKPSQKRFKCPYEDCSKLYDTLVSLNLHLKLKHNAGTKKQRQTYANAVIQAQNKGQSPPNGPIMLPPFFLQEYKSKKNFKQRYSM